MNMNFMELALCYAKEAYQINEVPVGAVIVKNDQVVGSAFNLRETKKNALYHAELLAISNACETLNDWRLDGCDLYVTLEPCPMCAGAILSSRISRLYFGAYDFKFGACGTNDNLFTRNKEMGNIEVYGGIMEEACLSLLKDFFNKLR